MTEQKAEALVTRLTRIWKPIDVWPCSNEKEVFSAHVDPEICLTVNEFNEGDLYFCLYVTKPGHGGSISYSEIGKLEWDIIRDPEQEYQQFLAQWLPFFRRGCWLSGCAVEATAHEKAEWMQGFTSEELESWNLKM